MRLWERIKRMVVQEFLQFGYGATLKVERVNGTVTSLSAGLLTDLKNSATPTTLAAARTLTALDSGMTFFLALATGFTVTLPAPAAGLRYKFFVATAPTSNGYLIVTNGGANIIILSVNELETDTTEDGPSDDNADTVTLVANLASLGDVLEFECDGTYWYAVGQTKLDGAVTSATT